MSVDLEERAKRAARMEPAWNELREQRVLGQITEARRRARGRGRRRARLMVAAAAVVLLAGGGTLLVREAMQPEAPVATGEPTPAHLDLPDDSTALLSQDAHVRVDSQGPGGVWLTQQGGTVTYEVTHDPDRSFVVRAGEVTVRVIGTRFVVAMDPGYVEVQVERGRVEVDGPEQHAVLGRGERVRIAAGAPRASPATPAETTDTAAEAEAPPGEEAASPSPSVEPSGRRPARRPSTPPSPSEAASPSMEGMLADADVARRAGKAREAGAILRRALAAHPDHEQAAAAWFTLGRVERNAGRPAEAARAFAEARQAAPRGPLAEDALAEAASAWKVAGDDERARAAAASYMAEYPGGLHVPRMRPLVE